MNRKHSKAASYRAALRKNAENYKGSDPFDPENKVFIEGTPCLIVADGLMVDMGGKWDGFCPNAEIGDAQLNQRTLFLVTSSRQEEMPALSRKKAEPWEAVCPYIIEGKTLFAEPLRLVSSKHNQLPKLLVKIEELPNYEIELPAWEVAGKLETLVGKNQLIPVVVKSMAPTRGCRGRIVVSNRKINFENKEEQLKKIRIGRVVDGKILKFLKAAKSDQDCSAFVLLNGGAIALLHRNEVKGYPERKLEQIFKIGDRVSVAVTRKHKLAVTMYYPELRTVLKGLKPGDVIEGKVLKATNGAYSLEVGRGIYGKLYPEDQILQEGRPEVLSIGSVVTVTVLECSANDLILKLGRRQLKTHLDHAKKS